MRKTSILELQSAVKILEILLVPFYSSWITARVLSVLLLQFSELTATNEDHSRAQRVEKKTRINRYLESIIQARWFQQALKIYAFFKLVGQTLLTIADYAAVFRTI